MAFCMNFSYFYTIFFKLKKDKFSDYCRSRSVDGGNTSVIFDSDIAIISHEGVVNEMETYCKRWSSGNIVRPNSLGQWFFDRKYVIYIIIDLVFK